MAPMEGANWAVGAWICSHRLCGPLVCHWPVCGPHLMAAHGVSQMVVFAPSHPTPPHPATHPTHPPIIKADGRKGRQKIPSNSAIRDREG